MRDFMQGIPENAEEMEVKGNLLTTYNSPYSDYHVALVQTSRKTWTVINCNQTIGIANCEHFTSEEKARDWFEKMIKTPDQIALL